MLETSSVVKTQGKSVSLTPGLRDCSLHHVVTWDTKGMQDPQDSFSTWNCGHTRDQSVNLKKEKQ